MGDIKMEKNVRRLLAVLMAFVLVLSTMPTAFAMEVATPQVIPDSATSVFEDDVRWLTWDVIRGLNSITSHVTTDLNLPIVGINGSEISWISDNHSAISTAIPGTGIVTRPASNASAVTVTITAFITDSDSSETVIFNLTVPPEGGDSIIINATNHATAYINLTAETIYVPIIVAEFSVNGGRTWTRRALPTGNALNNLFNRGLHLSVRSERGGGTRIDFPQINRRPRANAERLRPWFGDDTWALRARPTSANTVQSPPDAPVGEHEWVRGNDRGRMPANPIWQAMSPEGFEISATRETFFFRSAANSTNGQYTPASRQFRVRPATFRRALNLRPNYVTETLRTRLIHEYSFDNGVSWNPAPVDEAGRAIPLNLTFHITSGTPILVRTATNGRRPRTANQEIILRPRAQLAETLPHQLNVVNGRIDVNVARPFNIDVNGRWRAFPRFNATTSGERVVRVNSTARLSRGEWTGYASSLPGTLTVNWGVVGTDSRNRDVYGVLSAWITRSGMPAPSLDTIPESGIQEMEVPSYGDYDTAMFGITTPPALQMSGYSY